MFNPVNNQSNQTKTIDNSKQPNQKKSSRFQHPPQNIQSNIPVYITPLKTSNEESRTIICGEDPGMGCS